MRPDLTPATPRRILVVEDDPSINDVVSTALRFQGHSVIQSADGHAGLDLAIEGGVDLIVLDVMLPGIDGFEVCRRLREAGSGAPVLFLTARDETEHRIRGFATGGDDYLTKPFSVDELVMRVAAILRRTTSEDSGGLIQVGSLTLDPAGREVRRAGVLIDLSATEHRLLEYLMVNRGVVLSRRRSSTTSGATTTTARRTSWSCTSEDLRRKFTTITRSRSTPGAASGTSCARNLDEPHLAALGDPWAPLLATIAVGFMAFAIYVDSSDRSTRMAAIDRKRRFRSRRSRSCRRRAGARLPLALPAAGVGGASQVLPSGDHVGGP